MSNQRVEEISGMMEQTRADTLALFDLAREEDLRQSPGGGFRPVIWHLAHIGVFEAFWLLQKIRGENAPDEKWERIFDPIRTPREESKDLPTRREMEAYLARVRKGALRCLDEANFDARDPMLRGGYVFDLVLEHERQHQETLAYLLHMLDTSQKLRPRTTAFASGAMPASLSGVSSSPPSPGGMVEVAAGEFEFGSTWESFAYDNELPAHRVFVPSFKIDRLLTTNEEYARFIEEGGYRRREWWSAEGWTWREREDWTCPLYWRCDGAVAWSARTMFDEGALSPRHPVTGVSWYEAEAYARFMSKRLPTEAEWEKAASWDDAAQHKRRFAWGDAAPSRSLCNSDNLFWGTTGVGSFPEGASAYGCLDMTGNVWEWTSDPFRGFPGFEAFPYPEYSEHWFDDDHRVLKGGSWATRASVLRSSFRNFFRRHFRIAFAGIRLAE